MQEILCQTRFEGIDSKAGIGAYVANLNQNADYAITIRIGDNVQAALINRGNRTETYPVYFGGLENGVRYEVQCQIAENESCKIVTVPMYALIGGSHVESAQRTKGASSDRESGAHKGVGF